MINHVGFLSVLLALTGLAASVESYGQEHDEEAEHGEHHEYLKNSLELFLGATHSDDDTNFSIGTIYEHRVNETFGWGGVTEYTPDEGSWVLAVPFFIHPAEPWRVNIAPGVEMEGGEKNFLLRLGGSYEFESNNWAIAPEINFDLVDGDVNVVVGFGIRWKHRLIPVLRGM